MAQINALTLPEAAGVFNDVTVSLDDRMLAAMSQLVVDNQQLRTAATASMQKATTESSPAEMLKTLALLGDHKIHTETLLAYAREVNKGIETLIKS